MSKLLLHLDEDTSSKSLYKALLTRGYDLTRTPNEWMPSSASDKAQLLGATAHGRCIFTFNIRDFMPLAEEYPKHGGILLAVQSRWSLSALIEALDRVLKESKAEAWIGQIRWLNDWR